MVGLCSFISKTMESGSDVVKKLDNMGYFKYANSNRVLDLKSDLIKSFDDNKTLSTITDNRTYLPFDYRLYFCDGEALFERGGIEEYLGYARHAFEKRGLELTWKNEVSQEEGNYWNHRITVNDKEYLLFEGAIDKLDVWGAAQLNFYRMLNDQLKSQSSDERVYPISGGEDGRFIILSQDLFNYISKTFYQGQKVNKWEVPYPVEKWKELNRLD